MRRRREIEEKLQVALHGSSIICRRGENFELNMYFMILQNTHTHIQFSLKQKISLQCKLFDP